MRKSLIFLAVLLSGCATSDYGSFFLAAGQHQNAGPARDALVEYLPVEEQVLIRQELKYFDWVLALLESKNYKENALEYPSAFNQLCPNIESTAMVVNEYKNRTNTTIPDQVETFSVAMKPFCQRFEKAKSQNERIQIAFEAIEVIKMVAVLI